MGLGMEFTCCRKPRTDADALGVLVWVVCLFTTSYVTSRYGPAEHVTCFYLPRNYLLCRDTELLTVVESRITYYPRIQNADNARFQNWKEGDLSKGLVHSHPTPPEPRPLSSTTIHPTFTLPSSADRTCLHLWRHRDLAQNRHSWTITMMSPSPGNK